MSFKRAYELLHEESEFCELLIERGVWPWPFDKVSFLKLNAFSEQVLKKMCLFYQHEA